MKKHPHIKLIGIISVIFSLTLSAHAQNFISNSGFENWSGNPDDWSLHNTMDPTEVSGANAWDGSAVELGLTSANSQSALYQDFDNLSDEFFFSWEFAQEDQGSDRGMNLTFRDGSASVLNIRENQNQIEIYGGSWQPISGATISDSDFSTQTLNVYRIEVTGSLVSAEYDFSLYNITGGGNSLVTSQQDLSYWQTTPTASTAFDSVNLERGRSGSDYRVDNVVVSVPEPGTLALVSLTGIAGLLVARRRKQG